MLGSSPGQPAYRRIPPIGPLVCAAVVLLFGSFLAAQTPEGPPTDAPQQQVREDPPAPPEPSGTILRASVHGVVKNAATGEPLPRALVRIEGDAVTGALTDGDGRFEIPGVPSGPEVFQVIKPGFIDQSVAGMAAPPTVVNGASNSEHNVRIVPDMPDLVFSLTPTNAIRGQVELSSGDPAQGIAVLLLRRTVQDGRAVWQAATNVRTNSDGVYRFAGLTDGTYAIYTEPAMDSEIPVSSGDPGNEKAVTRAGYPSVFYPDARDLGGAGKIQLAGGQQTQANLLLTQEPFHMVRAVLTLPGAGGSPADSPQLNVTVTILDAQGRQLPYSGQYDPATHFVQAFLPDGTYTLQVTALGAPRTLSLSGRRLSIAGTPGSLIGQVDVSLSGHAITNLQIPLTPQHSNVIQVSLLRTNAQSQPNNSAQQSPLVVMVSQAGGWITDGMVSSYAEGYAIGPIESSANMSPGSYWIHTSIPQKGLCEGSFTAGGASLAREPLILAPSGTSAPLTLTLRDDCAFLSLALPSTVDTPESGEEPYYTVYVVPDFDSTVDVTPITLRPSSGGMLTVPGLTPGPYHVYTFAAPVELEYHNPEAMSALSNPGQAVTLTPSATTNLVVEVPGH